VDGPSAAAAALLRLGAMAIRLLLEEAASPVIWEDIYKFKFNFLNPSA